MFEVEIGDLIEVFVGTSSLIVGRINTLHGDSYFSVETPDNNWLIDVESVSALKFSKRKA
jgi:hypothetical protein